MVLSPETLGWRRKRGRGWQALLGTVAMQIESIESLIMAVTFLQYIQKAASTAALIHIRWNDIPVHPDAVRVLKSRRYFFTRR